jgi:hypothetical protein
MSYMTKANTAVRSTVKPMSSQVAEVRQRINLLQEAMRNTMKNGVHYGVIPSCGKPSLYKAGAEVIMALFRLSSDHVVTDMSKDGEIRYQVKSIIKSADGAFLGASYGECSSQEEKYMWRAAVCDEEYDSFPETQRRIKFKKWQNNVSQVKQVRCNPSDLANTILKMAVKRATIASILQCTSASDIFTQDIEDLPPEYIDQKPVHKEPVKEEMPNVESTEYNQDLVEAVPPVAKPQGNQKCTACDKSITDKVASYSKSKIGVALCYDCQKSGQEK